MPPRTVLPAPDPADLVRLAELGAEARAFLEPRWSAFWDERAARGMSRPAPGLAPSWSMCGFSSAFVAPILARLTGDKWVVRGGAPIEEADIRDVTGLYGGMRGRDGALHGHFWATDGRTVVDLTSDQFGWDPVTVVPADDRRYRANYKLRTVHLHLRDLTFRADLWRPDWEAREPSAAPAMR